VLGAFGGALTEALDCDESEQRRAMMIQQMPFIS
jgi:hypothetical protein